MPVKKTPQTLTLKNKTEQTKHQKTNPTQTKSTQPNSSPPALLPTKKKKKKRKAADNILSHSVRAMQNELKNCRLIVCLYNLFNIADVCWSKYLRVIKLLLQFCIVCCGRALPVWKRSSSKPKHDCKVPRLNLYKPKYG